MKILQVNCVYGEGSTGKITRDLHHSLLEQGIGSVVYYGRGRKCREPGVTKLCSEFYGKANNALSRIRGTMYGGCYLSTLRLIRCIQKEKPDIVHLQCINGYFVNIYKLLAWLKESGIKTVLTLHAEFMYTGNCGHAGDCEKWRTGCGNCPRLRKETKSLFFDRTAVSWRRLRKIYQDWNDLEVVCCSDWIRNRALQGMLGSRNMRTIHNGIDNDRIFYPHTGAGERVRQKYGIGPEKKLILFVAPFFSELKGFDLVLQLMAQCRELPFHFLLAGENRTMDLENGTVVGKITDQEQLAQLYSAADALVMCSRNDNYPTVCLEAVSCGTPVAGFDVGGVRETIPENMGGVVPLGDIAGMKGLLCRLVQTPPKAVDVDRARACHSKEHMAAQYAALYAGLLDI